MKTITVEFDEAGNPKVSVSGVAGKSCTKETADIEAALGKVTGTQKTRDYAKQEDTANRIKQ